MDTIAVHDLILQLNFNWFKRKNEFFIKEGLYDKDLKKVFSEFSETEYFEICENDWKEEETTIVVDIDLKKYCWSSNFYGSYSNSLEYEENSPEHPPLDSSEIAYNILAFICDVTENFSDVCMSSKQSELSLRECFLI